MVDLQLELDAAVSPGPDASSGLFQIAREALEQAVRRGPPGAVRIALRAAQAGGVELVLEDDAAPERREAVNDGLAERAAELNATFETTRDGDRTVTRVVVPPASATL